MVSPFGMYPTSQFSRKMPGVGDKADRIFDAENFADRPLVCMDQTRLKSIGVVGMSIPLEIFWT